MKGNDDKYIIYARKSSEEVGNSSRQEQSIGIQVEAALKLAKRDGLTIMKKNKDYLWFEKENINSEEAKNIAEKYPDYFIVTECYSAKIPGKRRCWTKIIKMCKQGKIKNIIVLENSRVARNMTEAGEILSLQNQGMLNIRFTNASFQGMSKSVSNLLLGIQFLISSQYSESLSENVLRGNNQKIKSGKSLGSFKYGFSTTSDGYYIPDKQSFDIIKKAFRLKTYTNITDKEIANLLNKWGFSKDGKRYEVKSKNLGKKIRLDTFYYGLFSYGNSKCDLRKLNPYFEPVITEKEHNILKNKYEEGYTRHFQRNSKKLINSIAPLHNGTIIDNSGYSFSISIPNINARHTKRLKELRASCPSLELSDIIKPHQIYYRSSSKQSPHFKLSLNYAIIKKNLIKFVQRIKISDEIYSSYVEQYNVIALGTNKNIDIEINKRKLLRDSLFEAKKAKQDNDSIKKNSDKIYQCGEEIKKLKKMKYGSLLSKRELQRVISLYPKIYDQTTYPTHKNLSEYIRKIRISDKKRVTIYPEHELEVLFQ